jgi:hypothetical protein
LSSLDRVELMVALEDTFQTRIDEGAFAGAQDLGSCARSSSARRRAPRRRPNGRSSRRGRAARSCARCARGQSRDVVMPLARAFAWRASRGSSTCASLEGAGDLRRQPSKLHGRPVIMAALPRRWRYRVAPAMAREMFAAHFSPRNTAAWRG